MIYVGNAFSLAMVPADLLPSVRLVRTVRPVLDGLQWTSCVGHADTAMLLRVPLNRVSVSLCIGDTLFVAQLQGVRLAEGATVLPAGASFTWIKVYFS